MTYSSFTLETVLQTFHLEKADIQGLFSEIEPIEPSAHLTAALARNVPLAVAINTEKAKSELIVADVLVELREELEQRISLFSGVDFNVDSESDLTGVCDFLISLSPWQQFVEAPVITLVEAKNDNLHSGLGQCVAEMVAAQRFNAEKGNDIPRVYGVTTTGVMWQFLKLEGQTLHMDMDVHTIERCDKLLGILASMVAQQA
ncbi:hypothetical protein C6495_17655 [Candidatus Poribacteria bacterium]|nr:MAG: hypothetical protein C6495_17655 [Candidatus Poribacteria bacterium]